MAAVLNCLVGSCGLVGLAIVVKFVLRVTVVVIVLVSPVTIRVLLVSTV